MLSDREAAVERVLGDLRELLLGREPESCSCGKGTKYTIPADGLLEARSALTRARTLCEFANKAAERALEQVELTEDLLP